MLGQHVLFMLGYFLDAIDVPTFMATLPYPRVLPETINIWVRILIVLLTFMNISFFQIRGVNTFINYIVSYIMIVLLTFVNIKVGTSLATSEAPRRHSGGHTFSNSRGGWHLARCQMSLKKMY